MSQLPLAILEHIDLDNSVINNSLLKGTENKKKRGRPPKDTKGAAEESISKPPKYDPSDTTRKLGRPSKLHSKSTMISGSPNGMSCGPFTFVYHSTNSITVL